MAKFSWALDMGLAIIWIGGEAEDLLPLPAAFDFRGVKSEAWYCLTLNFFLALALLPLFLLDLVSSPPPRFLFPPPPLCDLLFL